jgi:TetR/AcrR family transcriptional regulator, fatty acid metabolism regulator protein
MESSKSALAQQKKSAIIDAAVQVFAQKGFYNAKVSDVADAAGVAAGTIYLYFKNKDDLLISLFEEKMEAILQRFRTRLQDIDDPVEKLHTMVDVYFDLIEEDKQLATVFQVELRQSATFLKDYRNQKFLDYLNMIAAIIDDGIAQNFFRPDVHVGIIKIMIFGALDEVARQWILGADQKYSLELAKENLKQVLVNGLIMT